MHKSNVVIFIKVQAILFSSFMRFGFGFLQDPIEIILLKRSEVLNHDNKVQSSLNTEDFMVTIQ